MRTVCLWSCLLVAACGNPSLVQDEHGKYQVAKKCTPATLTETLVHATNATLVVTFGPTNHDVLTAVNAAKRTTRPFVVAVGQAPAADGEIPDAIIAATTGAREAVDLALLACNGVTVPNSRFELGTRTFTPANRAAGGTTRAAPGDAVLAMMRMQHASILTTKPTTDVIHFVGMLQDDPNNAWQTQALADASDAASSYPQIKRFAYAAGPEQIPATEQAKQMIEQGCRAIILASSDPQTTSEVLAAASKAADGAVPILVLDPLLQDHGTCVLGCSANSLGVAAASMVQQLLPEGGAMITCFGVGRGFEKTMSQDRVRGFCEAMGLPADRLLGR